MNCVTYTLTNDAAIPAVIQIGERTTPVWFQQRWEQGEYAEFINKNGCGHCCTAMAARLHGVNIDPHTEFAYCRQQWGIPQKELPYQENWISVSGIVKVLTQLNIKAEGFGVPVNKEKISAEHILKALSEGKQVIIWSQPSEKFPDNPFSKGSHYVLAAGYDANGKIVIANSSEKWTSTGIQLVDALTIEKALYSGSQPLDMTWGESKRHADCAGYVVVG